MTDKICLCNCPSPGDNYLIRANVVSILSLFVTTTAVYFQTKSWKTMLMVFIIMLIFALILIFWTEHVRKSNLNSNDNIFEGILK